MVATLSLRVYTGTGATTQSSAVNGIAFFGSPTDSAASDLASRQASPIVVGSNSMEKHLRLRIDVAPNTSVGPFRFYTDGSGTTNVGLKYRAAGTGGASAAGDATPVATAMTGTDAYTATAASPFTWDSVTYATVGHVTKALVLQLQPTASATPGAWPQEVLYLVFDEA